MRKIIHIDADCFFAAVEILKKPKLKGKPVAVGGDPSCRGVISTCNYDARKYGVKSAMASAQALRLCPSLIMVKPNMELYREYSLAMKAIFEDFTEKIEPLSLDEAFLDVSSSTKYRGSATLIAEKIRKKVYAELGITVSAGVATTKYLAKVASDWNKPNGIFVVSPSEQSQFIKKLSVKRLPGVGKVMENRLARCGIYNCAQVEAYGLEQLVLKFGRYGSRLYEMAIGLDDRPVLPRQFRKSVSVERTFAQDIKNSIIAEEYLPHLFEMLENRMRSVPKTTKAKKLFVKLKFDDFSQTTKEVAISSLMRSRYENSEEALLEVFMEDFRGLVHIAWQRGKRPLRLIGIGVGLESPQESPEQLTFCF